MKVAIGSDHAGWNLKNHIKQYLEESGVEVIDKGCDSPDISVDYPDYAKYVAKHVQENKTDKGILVCGSGIGISITANKFKGIRAALVTDENTAKLSRQHNDSNILVLSGRPFSKERCLNSEQIVKAWLDTEFEGGRHQKRLDKISQIEKENGL